ncbi:MAG TPA: hypothetical protein P5086_00360 [Prolixibacteraceae bacterium]|nr:hypothetical protein [Prolixibacteraceae bacterium]HRV87737.1 hypothetical protein [Prolixibacteraceae bacterium]
MKTNRLIIILLSLICWVRVAPAQSLSTEPGNVVFSSSLIDPASPAGLTTTFHAGDYLYAVAYLPQTLKEIYVNASPNEKLLVEIFIYEIKPPLYDYQQPREEQLTFANMYISGDLKQKNHVVMEMVPDPAVTQVYNTPGLTWNKFGKKYEGPVGFAEALAKLGPGEHTLKVVVQCYYSPAASGILKISGDDFAGYNRVAEQLNEAGAAAGMAHAVFPAAVVSDAPREARMVSALKNSNDWKSGFIDGTEVLKTAITYDWEIRRHEISGAILHRYCIAAMALKTKNGGCAYYKVTFQEDYAGGKFLPLRYDGVGDKVMLDCAKVK